MSVTDLDILVLLTTLWGGLSMLRTRPAGLRCRYCETPLHPDTGTFCSTRCEGEFTDLSFV